MTQIHTCYKVSKMLKEFLGESAPEPMADNTGHGRWWYERDNANLYVFKDDGYISYPAYQLHDLLNKPFLEAMFKKVRGFEFGGGWIIEDDSFDISVKLNSEYYNGGMEAVEKALVEMMEAK